MKYKYRVDSERHGSNIKLQTFCSSLYQLNQTIDEHQRELPGCMTRITNLETGHVKIHKDYDDYPSDYDPMGGIVPGVS